MRIKLEGKNLEDIRFLLPEYGLKECSDNFEAVVCHGGDGALLGAEREYPGVLKFPVRDAATAPTCPKHGIRERLRAFAAGELPCVHLPKLAGEWEKVRVTGINDVFLHNSIDCGALRFSVRIDGELYAREILGDGVGLATVHGSTAYYRSITRSVFRTGLGLAFSNATAEISHIVLPESATVEITVLRGPGLLIADNSPVTQVPAGAAVKFHLTEEKAAVCGLTDFMCPECRRLRHGRGSC